jgi:hypothetical protein
MPPGRDPRAIAADFQIIESLSPELRALVHEYGLKTVQTGRAAHNSNDPEKVEKFCIKERAARQRQLEAIAHTFDHRAMATSLIGGIAAYRMRTG